LFVLKFWFLAPEKITVTSESSDAGPPLVHVFGSGGISVNVVSGRGVGLLNERTISRWTIIVVYLLSMSNFCSLNFQDFRHGVVTSVVTLVHSPQSLVIKMS
jgi:hypothetical protein